MRYIVEYKLHGREIPSFIEDGGYYTIANKMIGITYDSSTCYIPKFVADGGDLVLLNNTDLINRVKSIYPSEEEQIAINDANNWLEIKGF
jgi:hypothetical protein